MNNTEKAKKDIEMAFDFARYLIDHPEELDNIPDGSEIAFNEKAEVQEKVISRTSVCVDVRNAFAINKKRFSHVARAHGAVHKKHSPKRRQPKV